MLCAAAIFLAFVFVLSKSMMTSRQRLTQNLATARFYFILCFYSLRCAYLELYNLRARWPVESKPMHAIRQWQRLFTTTTAAHIFRVSNAPAKNPNTPSSLFSFSIPLLQVGANSRRANTAGQRTTRTPLTICFPCRCHFSSKLTGSVRVCSTCYISVLLKKNNEKHTPHYHRVSRSIFRHPMFSEACSCALVISLAPGRAQMWDVPYLDLRAAKHPPPLPALLSLEYSRRKQKTRGNTYRL